MRKLLVTDEDVEVKEAVPKPHLASRPCPHPHTICPEGYVDWHEWAEKMIKTHKQDKCPTCGRWAIWRPRTEIEHD